MDRATAFESVPPLSPVSSESDSSLEEPVLGYLAKGLAIEDSLPSKHKNRTEGQLPTLQIANGDPDGLDPVTEEELDAGSFDLVTPGMRDDGAAPSKWKLEQRSELLFSQHHMRAIFSDPAHLNRFSNFLYKSRPASVPLFNYYLAALKALRAIDYSNSILRELRPIKGFTFSQGPEQTEKTANQELQDKADRAFEILTNEDLPAYVTHVWIQTVSASIRHRIMGTTSDSSEGLAEVFCLTDPSRPDNPIVFMSEQFNRTTQYGVDYVIGRNCRFLQGPCTSPFSVRRIREKVQAGIEHYETFLNYRRDGSPFMNLVMIAPLYDSRGKIRYFIGAQVDVSGLAMTSYDLGALGALARDDPNLKVDEPLKESGKDELTELAEILDPKEVDSIKSDGGSLHRLPLQASDSLRPFEHVHTANSEMANDARDHGNKHGSSNSRVVIRDKNSQEEIQISNDKGATESTNSTAAALSLRHNGRLTGVYENYLLVRPYPSLRILFTSPSMRVPGILQSPLLDRIGGSVRVRNELVQALSSGQGVTAKVKWLSASRRSNNRTASKKRDLSHPLEARLEADDDLDTTAEPEPEGRARWLHCTPLAGANSKVGVWMIVIVDDYESRERPQRARAPVIAVTAPNSARRKGVYDGPKTNGSKDGNYPGHRNSTLVDSDGREPSSMLGHHRSDLHVPLPKKQAVSVTQAIHEQNSANSRRTSKPISNSGVAASTASRFFSLDALARVTSGKYTKEPTSSKSSSRSSTSSSDRGPLRQEAPLPPWPARSDSRSANSSKMESQSRTVYTIPEEKARSEKSSGSSFTGDERRKSLDSFVSMFTVKIGDD